MRPFIFAAALLLTSVAAQAQPQAQPQPQAITNTPANNAAAQAQTAHPTGQKPVDNGPTTPQSNAAYNGGGVILQGAPGAPAPAPQRTDVPVGPVTGK